MTHILDNGLVAAHLAAIVESSGDAIIGKSLAGAISSWNRGAQSIFGYTPEEVIGRSVQILFPPHLADEENQIIERILCGERIDHFETVRRRKDGSDFHASVTISPIRDARGVIVGASKILRDISESHRTQADLRQAKLDLEQVVVERSKALAERDLLLREVYHRVKNNLQVVDGLLVLQAQQVQDPEAKAGLLGLRSRVFALALVHQQLMGSCDLKTFDIAPFLCKLSANLLDGAADDQVSLTVDACALQVGLDFATPLGMLVTEIVTNCFKHAFPEGGGRVSIDLRLIGREKVMLTIADNGGGGGGGGGHETPHAGRDNRGLAIIKKLVAQLGGEMKVRYEAGMVTEVLLPTPEASWAS